MVLSDLRERQKKRDAREPRAGEPDFTNTSAVASLLITVHFRTFVRSCRAAIWGSEEHPFKVEKDAAMWLEFVRRQEQKREDKAVQLFEDEEGKTCVLSFHVPPEDRRFLIFVPRGGILERLYLFCEALAKVSEWWDTDDVLRHVLFDVMPTAVRVSASGMGNYTESITIKIHGPATEEEVVRAYRAGCKITRTDENRKGLTRAQFKALYLVEYLMPEATWPERFKQWLEWCKEDERLPSYNASLKDDGSVDNPGAWRNLKHEYNRAMDKQSWTGKVPRLYASDEDFQKYIRKAFSQGRFPKPPPFSLGPWE